MCSPPCGTYGCCLVAKKYRVSVCRSKPAFLCDPPAAEPAGCLFYGGDVISAQEPRLNEEIPSGECRLIGADGSQLGIYDVEMAQSIADEQGMDLVEIAPDAKPPVCRVMDYGKFKYEQAMKAKQARKNQTRIEIKEMKFRPKIDKVDYETKKKHILRFLAGGAKVKVTIMFRGREMAHPQIGLNILEKLSEDLKGEALIENQPKLEGRNMFMLIAPLKKKEKETPNAKDEDA
jgi:translation initiation factor IF-3